MTKAEFVESLANTLNQTKSESERVLEAVVDVLKQALQRGEKIDLRGRLEADPNAVPKAWASRVRRVLRRPWLERQALRPTCSKERRVPFRV